MLLQRHRIQVRVTPAQDVLVHRPTDLEAVVTADRVVRVLGGACPMMVESSNRENQVLMTPGLEAASPDRKPVIVAGVEKGISEQVEGKGFVTYLPNLDIA